MSKALRVPAVPALHGITGDHISQALRTFGSSMRIARASSPEKAIAGKNQTYDIGVHINSDKLGDAVWKVWVQSVIVQVLVDQGMWPSNRGTKDFVFHWHSAYNDDEYTDIVIVDKAREDTLDDECDATLF